MDVHRSIIKFQKDPSELPLVDAFFLLKHFAEEKRGLIEGLSVQAIDLEHYDPAHYKSIKDEILERIGYQIKLSKLIPQKDMSEELSGFDVEEIVVFLSKIGTTLNNEKLREICRITDKKDFKNLMEILVRLKHNSTYIEERTIPQIYINLFKNKFPSFLKNEYRYHMAKIIEIIEINEGVLAINGLQKTEIEDMDDPSRVLTFARESDIKDINEIKSFYREDLRKISNTCSRILSVSSNEIKLFEKIESWEVMKIGFMNSLIRETEEISKKELGRLV